MKKTIKTTVVIDKIRNICETISTLSSVDVECAEACKIALNTCIEIIKEGAVGVNDAINDVYEEVDRITGYIETRTKLFTVVTRQHNQEVFRYDCEKLSVANNMIKSLCRISCADHNDLFFSLYYDGLEIANGDFLYYPDSHYYYYTDLRKGKECTLKLPLE